MLDIGCVIGQLFVAQGKRPGDGLRVGLDIDHEPLAYGARHFDSIGFLRGRAEALPFADASFDRVVSRVSLPYSHLPSALAEIRRVLRPGGRLWMSLHPPAQTWLELGNALRQRHPKDVIFRIFILLNGCLLHATGRILPFVNGRYESFQTAGGMRRLLAAREWCDIEARRGRHFVVSARKPGDGRGASLKAP